MICVHVLTLFLSDTFDDFRYGFRSLQVAVWILATRWRCCVDSIDCGQSVSLLGKVHRIT